MRSPDPGTRPPEIIGHRGYAAHYPENTLPSLEGALEAGCRSLEWDLAVSADGVPVLVHDDTLDRTTDGKGPVAARTMEDLRTLDAGSWFHPRFRGTRIPTLMEALGTVVGRVDRIYPEVKAARSPRDVEAILEALRDGGLHSRTTLISLDHHLLDEVRRMDPDLALGWVVARGEDMERATRRVEEDGNALLDPDVRLLLADPHGTRALAARGVPLATWTVNDPQEAGALWELGVHRITTDRVEALLEWAASQPLPPRGEPPR